MKPRRPLLCVAALSFVALSTLGLANQAVDWSRAEALGGSFTVYSFGESPFNRSPAFLSLEERRAFSRGSEVFLELRNEFSDAPLQSSHAFSCGTCHFRDGRGLTHIDDFAQSGLSLAPRPDGYSVAYRYPATGYEDIGHITDVSWQIADIVTLNDGTNVELVKPLAIIDGVTKPADLRNAPGVYGLGLLEAIPQAEIVASAEAQAYAEFGITGQISVPRDGSGPGRFGWKGDFAGLEAQVASAMSHELGIPQTAQSETYAEDHANLLADLTNYMRLLAVPARRDVDNPTVLAGAALFETTGCVMCHQPSWNTSSATDIPDAFRDKQIFPFTDLLLHDMGEGLSANTNDPNAQFWQTPPLWGIGMQASVSSAAGYLHDGRARTLLEAILWHGGEATYAVENFKALDADGRDALLRFLETL